MKLKPSDTITTNSGMHFSYFKFLVAAFAGTTIAKVPYKEYILAPPSRIVRPVSVYRINGTVTGAENLLVPSSSSGTLSLAGKSYVTYDFGKNIAGWVTLSVGDAKAAKSVSVTFSESSLWVSGETCDATADSGLDIPLVFELDGPGNYTAPWEKERGAFRYLSIVAGEPVDISDMYVYFTAMPHWKDDALQDYTGWFHSNDDQLNRVWYAGAYTNQLVTIDPARGNSLMADGVLDWWNNYTITNGTSALTDGAKRDRLVWAGDMAIAVPGLAVSTFDLISVSNSLDSLFVLQSEDGLLPYAGTPFNQRNIISFTYHLYTLIGVADYYHWSSDFEYLRGKWTAWKKGMQWSIDRVDNSGMMNVTSGADWLRFGMAGHNVEANSILYHTLKLGINLATALNDTLIIESYTSYMAGIKTAVNTLLWDASRNLYKDNEVSTLYPQDGNVWAIKAGVATPEQAILITSALRSRWGPYGAPAPEASDAISPFISGFELEAHFMVNKTQNALDLIGLMWGDFMLDDPRMTNSTFIEGYSVTGELHYAPYTNDPRISHAHGWGTGPTSTMTRFIAGIELLGNAGSTWSIAPQLGNLEYAEAGFSTSLGLFSSSWRKVSSRVLTLRLTTPRGTKGAIGVPTRGKNGVLEVEVKRGFRHFRYRVSYTSDEYERFWLTGLEGGDYILKAVSES